MQAEAEEREVKEDGNCNIRNKHSYMCTGMDKQIY